MLLGKADVLPAVQLQWPKPFEDSEGEQEGISSGDVNVDFAEPALKKRKQGRHAKKAFSLQALID